MYMYLKKFINKSPVCVLEFGESFVCLLEFLPCNKSPPYCLNDSGSSSKSLFRNKNKIINKNNKFVPFVFKERERERLPLIQLVLHFQLEASSSIPVSPGQTQHCPTWSE